MLIVIHICVLNKSKDLTGMVIIKKTVMNTDKEIEELETIHIADGNVK